MKRITAMLVLALIALILITASPAVTAAADTFRYARAVVRNAYFFTQPNPSTAIFSVPYTYCIEVIGDEGEWYRARYAADTGVYRVLTGYCRKRDFKEVEGVPAVTYLYKTVTVTYAVSSTPTTLPVLNEIALQAAYYGTYDSGAAVYSYVYCQGSFGYIEGANDDYPLNEIESDEQPEEAGGGQESAGGGISAGLISVIVILALFVAVVLTLHFATSKPARKDYDGFKRQ